MEGCSQGVLLWKAKMILGYIYRRMTCTAQEAIIRLPSTLVRCLLDTMPSLSHFEVWEPRVGNDVTGNPYLDWILKNLDRWRQPFHGSPHHRIAGMRKEDGKGRESSQPEISLQPSGLSSENFQNQFYLFPLQSRLRSPAWALSLQRLEGLA